MRTKKYLKKNLKRVKMTKKFKKELCIKVNKLRRRRRSKLTKKMKNKRNMRNMRNMRMFSKKRSRYIKGGFGKGACPFVGAPWDATDKAYYYKHSKNGISPGSTPIYPGNNSPSPQQGGRFLQPLINSFRVLETGAENVVNRYKGLKLKPSSLPMYDQLVRKKL